MLALAPPVEAPTFDPSSLLSGAAAACEETLVACAALPSVAIGLGLYTIEPAPIKQFFEHVGSQIYDFFDPQPKDPPEPTLQLLQRLRRNHNFLIDTNDVYRYKGVVSLLRPGDTAVISWQVQQELRQNAARAKQPLVYPNHPFPIVPDVPNLSTEIVLGMALRRYQAADQGFQGDLIIGTTAIMTNRIVVSDDRAFVEALNSIGGRAVFYP